MSVTRVNAFLAFLSVQYNYNRGGGGCVSKNNFVFVRALIAFVFNLSNLRDFQLRKTRGC